MPIDFKKLAEDLKKPRFEYLYRCANCYEEEWYITMFRNPYGHHRKNTRWCNGMLLLIDTRERT